MIENVKPICCGHKYSTCQILISTTMFSVNRSATLNLWGLYSLQGTEALGGKNSSKSNSKKKKGYICWEFRITQVPVQVLKDASAWIMLWLDAPLQLRLCNYLLYINIIFFDRIKMNLNSEYWFPNYAIFVFVDSVSY